MTKKNKGFQYANALPIPTEIIQLFRKNPRKPYNVKEIATKLGINNKEGKHSVEFHIDKLLQQNEIEETQQGKYRLVSKGGYIIGKIDLTAYGTAYVISPESKEDIFISSSNLNHALNGDTVKVYLFAKNQVYFPVMPC